jgi:hypothetical protein
MVDRGDEVVIDSGGEYLRQISLEGSDCQVVFTDAIALATGPSFFCLVPAHVIQFTIVNILIFTTAFPQISSSLVCQGLSLLSMQRNKHGSISGSYQAHTTGLERLRRGSRKVVPCE